jgi:DNA-binding NarL/FixJ family response regulator
MSNRKNTKGHKKMGYIYTSNLTSGCIMKKMEGQNQTKKQKLVIIHPSEIIGLALSALLEKNGYKNNSVCSDLEALPKQHDDANVDIVLAHCSNCLSARKIDKVKRKLGARIAIIASSDTYHKDYYHQISSLLASGVSGFLDMNQKLCMFLSELEDVSNGDIVISKNFTHNLIKEATNLNTSEESEGLLSQREQRVLEYISEGKTNREIAEQLYISEHTVKSYLTSILSKLNLKNRQQVAVYAVEKRIKDAGNAIPA